MCQTDRLKLRKYFVSKKLTIVQIRVYQSESKIPFGGHDRNIWGYEQLTGQRGRP